MNFTLQELLEKIHIEHNPYFINNLLKERQVNKFIFDTCKRFRIRRSLVEKWIKDYTLKEYVLDNCFVEERYLNKIRKYIGERAVKNGERTTRE